jgi:hypothetical protein
MKDELKDMDAPRERVGVAAQEAARAPEAQKPTVDY